MAEKFMKACMVLLYGKSILDGYYTSASENIDNKKRYVFSSVFPSKESMELALAQAPTDV